MSFLGVIEEKLYQKSRVLFNSSKKNLDEECKDGEKKPIEAEVQREQRSRLLRQKQGRVPPEPVFFHLLFILLLALWMGGAFLIHGGIFIERRGEVWLGWNIH